MSAAAFRQLLEDGDVDALRAAWAQVMPGLPQPESREHAEVSMHHARTQTVSIPLRPRAYSHRWLTERGLPSGLPDPLRPMAERMYPVIAGAVGISVNTSNEWLRPAMLEVRTAMEHAVEDCYADNETDPGYVRARMMEVREHTLRQLFGSSLRGEAS